MDTAQRGMGLDWAATRELIRAQRRRGRASVGGLIALRRRHRPRSRQPPHARRGIAAYEKQIEVVEGAGAQVILMASRQLAAIASGADDYRDGVRALLAQLVAAR